jgi:hypothetical protein
VPADDLSQVTECYADDAVAISPAFGLTRHLNSPSLLATVVQSLGLARWVMLFIAIVCLILWLLGMMTTTTLGGVLHILLVVAVVLFLVHIIQGSSVGNA